MQPRSKNRILYLHEEPPADGLGCGIVIKRHLIRLQDSGFEIRVAHNERFNSDGTIPTEWLVPPLPHRRWWWPPCRSTTSSMYDLRLNLLRRELQNRLKNWRPDLLVTQLYRRYPLLASHCAKAWQAPMGVFVFDEREVWESDPSERAVLRNESATVLNSASHTWFVSGQMRDAYRDVLEQTSLEQTSLLRPVPSAFESRFADWNTTSQSRTTIAYAGSLHGFHIPALEAVANALHAVHGELLVICEQGNTTLRKLQSRHENVRHHGFLHQEALIPFLKKNATAALVAYAFESGAQPWSRCSFPSKFLEFAQTGLPVLLLTPPDTALHAWAKENKWQGLFEDPGDELIAKYIAELTKRERWSLLAKQTQDAASGEFNPDTIHSQFEKELENQLIHS